MYLCLKNQPVYELAPGTSRMMPVGRDLIPTEHRRRLYPCLASDTPYLALFYT